MLEGNIPLFPWTTIVPSTPKLTCGLTRNTERTGSTETPHQHRPAGTTTHPTGARVQIFLTPRRSAALRKSSHVNVGCRQGRS